MEASAARQVQAEVGLAAARQRLHDVPAQRGQQQLVVRLCARAPARQCKACGRGRAAGCAPARSCNGGKRPAAPASDGRPRRRGACAACSAVAPLLAAARGRARTLLRHGRAPA